MMAAAVCASCDLDILGGCENFSSPAIFALPIDSATGQAIFTPVVTGVATEGAYTDTTKTGVETPPPELAFAWDRPGTYTLSVTAPGYAPWSLDSIVVRREGSCNTLQTFLVNVRLQPAPAS
jgi:hypothetical protein